MGKANYHYEMRGVDYMMWTAFVLIMIHLKGYKPENVFWEVYYKFVHDLIIVGFSLYCAYKPKTNIIGSVTAIGFATFFCAPVMIRLNLAIQYYNDYKAYRAAISNDNYSIILLLFIFVILLAIYFLKLYYGKRR